FEDATTDEKQINKWWAEKPDANIGIPMGRVSGMIALDIDFRHGGDKSLRQIERAYGPLPDTPRARTGSGGLHYLFRHPGGRIKNSQGSIARGIDARGDGGFIVVPGSLHASGERYRWELSLDDVELAPIPKFIQSGSVMERTE